MHVHTGSDCRVERRTNIQNLKKRLTQTAHYGITDEYLPKLTVHSVLYLITRVASGETAALISLINIDSKQKHGLESVYGLQNPPRSNRPGVVNLLVRVINTIYDPLHIFNKTYKPIEYRYIYIYIYLYLNIGSLSHILNPDPEE